MSKIHTLGASVGKASPAPQPVLSFFNQIVGGPNPLDPSQMVIQVVTGTGISARDYFAAHAMATCHDSCLAGGPDTPSQVARWCYRIADAMIAERSRVQDSGNDSQFHEDHMK